LKAAGQMIYKVMLVAWDGAWIVCLSELCWLALSLFIVTAPAAAAGMYYTMKELAYGESVDWKTFFRGVKKHFWAGYRWAGFNLLAVGLLVFYAWFFSASKADWGQLISGIPLGLFILWVILQTFTFPLMLEQEKPSYRNALRNSLVIFLKWPGYALGIVLFNAVILGLSVWLRFPWAILTFSLTALVTSYGLKEKLTVVAHREKPDPEGIR
jgi:hypothetical protein